MINRFKDFTVLISKISRSIKRIKTKEMKDYDLKSPHVSCLYYLYKEETLTAKELTDICYEDKASISRSLDYLEKNGFIICEETTKKKYNNHLNLTEKGKMVGEGISKKIDDIINEAGKDLTERDRIIFYQCLNKISENLMNIDNKE